MENSEQQPSTMTSEQINAAIQTAVNAALAPIVEQVKAFTGQSQEPKGGNPDENEASPSVQAWLDDKKTDRYGGKSLEYKAKEDIQVGKNV